MDMDYEIVPLERLPQSIAPPATLFAFIWHFMRQIKWLLLALLALEACGAAFTATVPVILGRLVNEINGSGGAIVTGTLREVSAIPLGAHHVWLSTGTDGELIARFVIPAMNASAVSRLRVGEPVELACTAVYRSYALVIGDCTIN